MKKVFSNHKDIFLDIKKINSNNFNVYLIIGPQGIGKYSYAKKIAQFYFCEDLNKPCGKCLNCCKIREYNHPDLIIIKPKNTPNNSLSISEAREIRRLANLSSHSGGYQIFIIHQAEKLTIEAQNALLKTLEEPTQKSVFILTTSNENLILPTILSRCQKIRLKISSQKQIKNKLKNYDLKNEEIDMISRFATGRPKMAIKLAKNKNLIKEIFEQFKEIKNSVKNKNIFKRFEKAENLQKTQKAPELFEFFEIFFRDLVHIKIGSDKFLINFWDKEDLLAISKNFTFEDLLGIIRNIEKIKIGCSQNLNLKFAIENLMLEI